MAVGRKFWIWVIVAVLAVGVLAVAGMAGFGYYFVTRHIRADQSSPADAISAFEEARRPFKDAPAVFEIDNREELRVTARLKELPTASRRPDTLWILAWDPDRERLVKVSMPFWLLRLGRQKIDFTTGGLDFDRLQLDVNELERIGPAVLFDHRPADGRRVLVWTQ